MQSRRLAKRYAKVLADLAEQQGELEGALASMHALLAICRELGPLPEMLSDRKTPVEERLKTLEQVSSALEHSELFGNFMRLLVERGRFGIVEHIAEEFEIMHDARLGILHLKVRTARPLSDSERLEVARAFQGSGSRLPVVHEEVDPSIIGGISVEVNNTVYDNTLAARIARMRERLVNP
jgi:F-type H+-transporting ATPase subunit delta